MEEHGENFVGFFSLFSVCKNKNNIASIEKANVDEKKKLIHSHTQGRQAGNERKKKKIGCWWCERERRRRARRSPLHISKAYFFSRWTHNRIKKIIFECFLVLHAPPNRIEIFSSSSSSFSYTFSLSHSLFQLLYVHILMRYAAAAALMSSTYSFIYESYYDRPVWEGLFSSFK